MTVPESTPTIVGSLACQKDSYRRTLETKVVSCAEYVPPKNQANGKGRKQKAPEAAPAEPARQWMIEFEDSVLFPEGGGQPTDHGTISPLEADADGEEKASPISITNLQRHGLRCVAFSPVPVAPGSVVKQDVNWERRWDHMQQHTGQHLLSAVMDTMDLETVGWSMGAQDEMNYVELPRKPTSGEIRDVQDRCNGFIRLNMPISVDTPKDAKSDSLPGDYDAEKGVVRLISIGDLDVNPCCGTHLKQTSHIGLILLHHTQGIRSTNCRLYFTCGDRAIKLATASINSLRSIAVLLSAGSVPSEVEAAVQKLGEKEQEARRREKKLLAEVAKFESERIKADLAAGKNGWCYRPTGDLDFINSVMFEVKGSVGDRAVMMATGQDKNSGSLVIVGEKGVVEELSVKAKAAVSTLKGGGKGEKWQGKVTEWKKGEVDALQKVVRE